jgi:hypothetical protein
MNNKGFVRQPLLPKNTIPQNLEIHFSKIILAQFVPRIYFNL